MDQQSLLFFGDNYLHNSDSSIHTYSQLKQIPCISHILRTLSKNPPPVSTSAKHPYHQKPALLLFPPFPFAHREDSIVCHHGRLLIISCGYNRDRRRSIQNKTEKSTDFSETTKQTTTSLKSRTSRSCSTSSCGCCSITIITCPHHTHRFKRPQAHTYGRVKLFPCDLR